MAIPRHVRKLASVDRSIPWDRPLPSHYLISLLVDRTVQSQYCEYLMEGGDVSNDCALAPRSQSPNPATLSPQAAGSTSGPPRTTVDYSSSPIGRNWYTGSCKGAPVCTYRQACLKWSQRGIRQVSAPSFIYPGGVCTDWSPVGLTTSMSENRSIVWRPLSFGLLLFCFFCCKKTRKLSWLSSFSQLFSFGLVTL